MPTDQPWYHQLSAAGKGPDWIFDATFAGDAGERLGAFVRALGPAGFIYYRAAQAPCPIHGGPCDYDLYADSNQYEAIVAQCEGRPAGNVYIYHTIQACRDAFQIVRGYGGYPGQHGPEETRCLRALAQAPELAMSSWRIAYGGMGYPYEQLAGGATAGELLRYLDAGAP
jgi:hypothetical protein